MDASTFELVRQGIVSYIILISSIALHEYGHAKSADMLGNDVPRVQGRVTLNPFVHLDPIGTGLIPLFMIFVPILAGSLPFSVIGWGRPVMVDPNQFRNRVRDHLISVAAGPFMNLLICIAMAVIGGLVLPFAPKLDILFVTAIYINAALIVFNLIPVPPLDGSHFLRYATGMSEEAFIKLSMYGVFGLLILINIPGFRMILGNLIVSVATPFFIIMSSIHSMFIA